MQNQCAEIKLRAESKAGEMLAAEKVASCNQHSGPRLTDLGVTKTQSSRWQSIASIPETRFEQHVAETREANRELTTAGRSCRAQSDPRPCWTHGNGSTPISGVTPMNAAPNRNGPDTLDHETYRTIVAEAGKGPPLIVLTPDMLLLIGKLFEDHFRGAVGVDTSTVQVVSQAIATAGLRMLDQTPDARQRIMDELQRMIDAGEGVTQ